MKHYLPNGSYAEVLRSTFESDTNVGIKMNGSEKPNSWVVVEENATTTNNAQKVRVEGVKIPVLSMEDVPKLAKEMEK